jgi:hypothetical protein
MSCCAIQPTEFGATGHARFFDSLFSSMPFTRRKDCVNALSGERCERLVLPHTAATRPPLFPYL